MSKYYIFISDSEGDGAYSHIGEGTKEQASARYEAAPGLLAACEAALSYLRSDELHFYEFNYVTLHELCDRIEGNIAKAKGDQCTV